MALLDLLGRRWALRILWELRDKSLTFRALRDAVDDVSPTVLNARLAELRDVDIVVGTSSGYVLTEHGHGLFRALTPLYSFAESWGKHLD
jgi:DNA-binding HxlR family transcriptional regulator